ALHRGVQPPPRVLSAGYLQAGEGDQRVRRASGTYDTGEYRSRGAALLCEDEGGGGAVGAASRPPPHGRSGGRPYLRMLNMLEKSSVQMRNGRSGFRILASRNRSGCESATERFMISVHEHPKQKVWSSGV